MNLYFYNNRKKILFIGVFLFLIGVVLAYLKWGFEPEETIAGVFCGLGFGISLLSFSLKKE